MPYLANFYNSAHGKKGALDGKCYVEAVDSIVYECGSAEPWWNLKVVRGLCNMR